MSSPDISGNPRQLSILGREYTNLGKSIPIFKTYLETLENLSQAKQVLSTESDSDMIALAKEEITEIESSLPDLEQRVRTQLVPRHPDDDKNAIVEIRAGTGGTEAGLFGADLFRMYTHFCENAGLRIEIMSMSEGERDAIKEVIFMVSSPAGAYGILKYESGVHRVQRVPETEAQGRIHTSAATVVVFPEVDELEVTIDPADLRVDVYRSTGHGGQSVNTTDSAVRIVHLPSGLVVTCQDEKSQLKNKAKAMKVLQSRLYDKMKSEREAEETASRRSMVSTGDRSAKIRTYNFSQNRVTDHRINLTLYSLDRFINGDIQEMIDALSTAEINEKLKESQIE
jgi:peptide chain release factor 1